MAGMFYTLQEAMQKLGKTEDQLKETVKKGELREYRDGTKVLYKQEEVNKLAQNAEPIDLVADSELNLELEQTSEIQLTPDDSTPPKTKDSEGGFGLSQMGDLTMADTNVGTVGINVLGGTDDLYKITADTKAETKAVDAEEVESLDADANLESVGSGSGLLDLSLQADDTSLGAVLDDILPTGPDIPAQAADAAPMEIGKDEAVGSESAGMHAAPSAAAIGVAEASPGAPVMVVVPEDPASNLYGVMMFFPLIALILAGIATAAGLQNILPSLIHFMAYKGVSNMNWGFIIALVLLVVVLVFAVWAMMAGGGKSKAAAGVYQKKPS